MHPILFRWDVPASLQGLLGESIAVYSYPTLILLGAICAFLYAGKRMHAEFGLRWSELRSAAILIFLAAYVGGRGAFILESGLASFTEVRQAISGGGFVFYGSAICVAVTVPSYLKLKRLPMFASLDVLAMTTCIVHAFGRIGCLFAGCCHGSPTNSWLSLEFGHPESLARPLGQALHPTQLYSAFAICGIFACLEWVRRRSPTPGHVLATYLMLYSVARFAIEFLRGDEHRGYFIHDFVSRAQGISIAVFVVGIALMVLTRKQQDLPKKGIRPNSDTGPDAQNRTIRS